MDQIQTIYNKNRDNVKNNEVNQDNFELYNIK